MEEYRNEVSNLHAIQSQNISKFTSNISKNTSKFTSKTNQIRLAGCHRGLGLPGMAKSLSSAKYPLGVGPKAQRARHPCLGRYTREKARKGLGCSPEVFP